MSGPAAWTVLLALALGLAWHWRPRRPAPPELRLLLAAFALLGGWALWFGLWAPPSAEPAAIGVWKPCIFYWLLAALLLGAPALGLDYPVKALLGTYFVFSRREWWLINLATAVSFVLLGAGTLLASFLMSPVEWQGIKWACLVPLMFVFLFRVCFVWVELVVKLAVASYRRGRALVSLARRRRP